MASDVEVEEEFYADPSGVYVIHNGQRFYKDGILYGFVLGEDEPAPKELPIPNLFSSIVIIYRAKAKEVYAVQVSSDNARRVADWCDGVVNQVISDENHVCVDVRTPEGVVRALEGDYVVKHTEGDFRSYTAEDFANTFEIV